MKITDLITVEELKQEMERPESEISGSVIPTFSDGRPEPDFAMTAEQVSAIDMVKPIANMLAPKFGREDFSAIMLVLQSMQVVLNRKFAASNEKMHETLRQGWTTHN